jgi:hypothetical protein
MTISFEAVTIIAVKPLGSAHPQIAGMVLECRENCILRKTFLYSEMLKRIVSGLRRRTPDKK